MFVFCVPLYIHLDVVPFLPFEISSSVARWFTPITFGVTLLAGLFLLVVFVLAIINLLGLGYRGLFPQKAVIARHPYGAKIAPEKYMELRHCPKCNSNKVYCAKCQRASPFDAFVSGDGCDHCGHPYIAVKQ